MKTITGEAGIQGSDAWLESRRNARSASEAPSMMGEQSYGMTRAQLLAFKATGIQENVSDFLKAKFQQGHDAEALARPIAEVIIGAELYPAVGESDDGYLRASFDGITMDGIGWEHKLYSDKLAAMIECGDIAPQYYWQLEQQCIVGGLSKILFMASDGTPENMVYMWYVPHQGRKEMLLEGWQQFDKDLAEWVDQERTDQDWFDACERYRAAKMELDRAQAKMDESKAELIELSPSGGYGCGIKLSKVERTGSVQYAKLVKDLKIPKEDIEKYRGSGTSYFTVDFLNKE